MSMRSTTGRLTGDHGVLISEGVDELLVVPTSLSPPGNVRVRKINK